MPQRKTTITDTDERLIEVNLHYELPVYFPSADENGELTYIRRDVSPMCGIKVKLPAYALKSKKDLHNFFLSQYESECMTMIAPMNENILIEDKEHGEEYFLWKSTFGRYEF